MNNANCLTFLTNNLKGIQNNSKRLSIIDYFKNKLGNNRNLLMYLSFIHVVPLNPVVSLLLFLEISTFQLTNK